MSRAGEVPQEITLERAVATPRRGLQPVRSSATPEPEVFHLLARIEELEREQARIEAQNAALQQQNAALEDFAAMAAHEVLKPLVMVAALTTGVVDREPALDPESIGDLELLMRISARVRVEVEALLIDALGNERPLQSAPVDMAAVVRMSLEALDSEIAAREARVDVAPLPVVDGHAALLTGVFGNLLSNALRYGPAAGAGIQVTASRKRRGWRFEVASEGRPIAEQDRDRIFEPWQRGIGVRRAQGAGLGLAIVRRVVERHGGDVGVLPIKAGNRFYFTLPA